MVEGYSIYKKFEIKMTNTKAYMDENYLQNASYEDLKTHFDPDRCHIFFKRSKRKEKVKKIISLKFKSIVDEDDFQVPTMLYEPENANENIILFLHGGGWVRGSIDSHDCLCRKIANTLNTRVVSVEYRLASKYKFPIALNDALSVYCGLLDDTEINFDKIILSGDSSGGNLCASLCIKLKEIKCRHFPAVQILFYPVLSSDFNSDSYIKFGRESNLTKSMRQWFVYMYTGKDPTNAEMVNNELLYPILKKDMNVFPKTLIVSAENDVLLDGQSLFCNKLAKADIATHHLLIANAKHGFMTYGDQHWKFASEALQKIKRLFPTFILEDR
jgi:acetyl esterase